ncbi:unnamed protein product [Kuraishia capsulata CBS 1993]|uniref:Uracil catabolism protein 4 n=1 Tax=Kuraishia capsulata CBS 1993 TaxID=1382522 RepID=W6MLL9_9ASCO|nr:uncharacterized protein KUCA_T00001717001 [Kuraishia capsulata CBS 1993]CDK25747.1 unnamed protein product [Kuraishia capsulata CBS 1993]
MTEHTDYLQTIKSVRETNSFVKKLLEKNELVNFNVDLTQLDRVVDYVANTIRGSFPTEEDFLKIPIHGRWQHFEVGEIPRISKLIENEWSGLDNMSICKKLIDIFIVSVLLDAGAGNEWEFEENGVKYGRSEGIAVASLHMFKNGIFSSDPSDPFKVNGSALAQLTEESLAKGFQVGPGNSIVGFDGRLKLLRTLGQTLCSNQTIFGTDGRPSNIVDYLISLPDTKKVSGVFTVDLQQLWWCLMTGLSPIWPEEGRIKVEGKTIGDAWFSKAKSREVGTGNQEEWKKVVTFHKLTQWLTYSLFLPLQKYGGVKIEHAELMTGLPEYRNGGLFYDFGVISLNKDALDLGLDRSKRNGSDESIPTFTPESDVIVEWRSCTISLLDMLLPLVNDKLKVTGTKYELSLPQLIEAGSWKSGRLIAKELRPGTGGPPIELEADGTVF